MTNSFNKGSQIIMYWTVLVIISAGNSEGLGKAKAHLQCNGSTVHSIKGIYIQEKCICNSITLAKRENERELNKNCVFYSLAVDVK